MTRCLCFLLLHVTTLLRLSIPPGARTVIHTRISVDPNSCVWVSLRDSDPHIVRRCNGRNCGNAKEERDCEEYDSEKFPHCGSLRGLEGLENARSGVLISL